MAEKCPAKYKNLNYIQSFSEQGYATIQLMQQACMNEEWLRQRVLKLNYLSSPAVRKWFGKDFESWIDNTVSYGYKFDNNGNVCFSNSIYKLITIDFQDDEHKIDKDKSTVSFVAVNQNSNKVVDGVPENVTDLETAEETADLTGIKTNFDYLETHYDADGSIISLDEDGELVGTPIADVEDNDDDEISHRCQIPFENEVAKYTYETDKITQKAQSALYNYTTRTIKKNQGCNSAWYVGWNKSKPYYIRPDWIKQPNGWRDKEIPSVARGQTFKATVTGYLESIDLKLDYTGTHVSDCGSPLYVQIWDTYMSKRPKTKWNTKKLKMEYVYVKNKNKKGDYNLVNGKYKSVKKGTGDYSRVYEKIPFPKAKVSVTKKDKNGKKVTKKYRAINKPLAQAIYNPSSMKSFDLVNIKFDKQYKLEKGKSYFIALFSPLSEWKHCPRWGGWGRNCAKDKKYQYGNAFLSEDNGTTWIRFGRNDTSVKYKLGRYVPQDFAFQCHIRTRDKKSEKHQTVVHTEEGVIDDAGPENPAYLYLKPIFDNPITHVMINANAHGANVSDWVSDGIAVRFDFKTNHMKEWQQDVPLGQLIEVSPNSKGEYPNILHVRARLYRDIETLDSNNRQKWRKATPYIESMNVELHTQLPKQMYVRTAEYTPRNGSNILGASLWGRLYSVFETDPMVECSAEIVTNDRPTDHFKIIEVENVKQYVELNLLNEDDGEEDTVHKKIISDLDTIMADTNTINSVGDNLCIYLHQNYDIITELKTKNVYVKPYYKDDYVYLMSFMKDNGEDMIPETDYNDNIISGLKFSNEVAYPIIECRLTADNSGTNPTTYSEWHDFTFDYDENELIFKKDVLDALTVGDIGVQYNKVFISGLTKEEVGVRVDTETGLREEGLVLDYFKQTFMIDENNLESKRVKLRVEPVDPIREVVLNRDTDDEKELYEGYDYDVDIDNKELVFRVNNTDNASTVLSYGDILEVVYTPNLSASGLSVGYWCKRQNTDKNVSIGSSYWEYKV